MLIETEIGAKLRAVDFIFRSLGENRPLHLLEENLRANINNTFIATKLTVANTAKPILQLVKRAITTKLPPISWYRLRDVARVHSR